MSKAKDPESRGNVYISRNPCTKRKYHEDESCQNIPDEYKEIELWKLKGQYPPCAYCTDKDHPLQHNNNTAYFECAGCGQERKLGKTGVRALNACHECDDMTTWDRVDDV